MNKTGPALIAIGLAIAGLTACTSQADQASENLSKAAENFEVPRRIVGVNGITDNVLFSVEGFCSYETGGGKYDITCKNPDGSYFRTTMGKSDNVTIVVTQMAGVKVDSFRPRVIFRPETIIPNFDLATSGNTGNPPAVPKSEG
jgi:hypothetical protein